MSNIFEGEVYEYLINESRNNRNGWNGNAGMIDGNTEIDLENSKKGVEFMSAFLQEHRPKRILETGTNYGSFSYILYSNLEEFKLDTCDIVKDNSERCIDFINSHFGKHNVTFHNMDSIDFLTKIKDGGGQYDMAWIDSHHTYDFLIEELRIVGEITPGFIVVDDFWFSKELQMAVFDFLKENDVYRFHSFSNRRTPIGSIVVLQKMR